MGPNRPKLRGRADIRGRMLKTRAEHEGTTPTELVLENGESVDVRVGADGLVHVGCVTITKQAWDELVAEVTRLRATR